MHFDENEETLLRSVALQNAKSILLTRERAERELIETKEELARSLARMRATLESTTDGILVTDAAGHVTDFNRKYVEMWQMPDEVMNSREHRQLLEVCGRQCSDSQQFHRRIDNIEASSPADTYDVLDLADGRVFERFSNIQVVDGKTVGRVWSFRDITNRQRAEDALRRSEKLLSDFFENAAVGLHWVGPDGKILRANRTELELLGYSEKEYVGHHISEFHADAPVVEAILKKLTCGDTLQNYEARLRCKDGSLRHVLISSNVLWEDGKFVHTRCFTRDVTEQKLAELALRESENRKSAILNAALDAIITMDHKGNILDFNPAAEKVFGYCREDAIGKPLAELIVPQRSGRHHTEGLFQHLATGEGPVLGQRVKLPALHADGHEFPAEVSIARISEVEPPMYTATLRDISERERMEEARLRLAAVVESSDDAIVSKTPEGIISTWNKGAERMFGYGAEEVIGKPITILLPADRMDDEVAILRRLKRGERIEHYEAVRMRKDGTLLDISLSVSPIKDDTGKVIGASKIARDITERKRAEQSLREAQETLSRYAEDLEKQVAERTASLRETIGELEAFSYSISHDLRAPLRAMQSFALILAEDCAGQVSPTGKEYIRRITTAADRMDRLIKDVLTYSRVTRAELSLESIDVQQLLRDILELYPIFQLPAAEIQLEGSFPWVLGTEAVLTQCFSNVLSNAVKFVRPGVTPRLQIWAETVENGDMVRLFFKDNGLGIHKEARESIFGIFQRVSNNYDGTGIGLAIVKKGVERMGGKVGLTSELGQGSTFWLELQRANNGTK